MLNLLQQLTPAETLLLTQLETCTRKELMKHTFLDLLLREVLVYSKKDVENEEIVYVKAGSQLRTTLLPHETVFTDTFFKSPDLVIPLKMFVKTAYKKAGNENQYKRLVRKTEMLAPAVELTTWGWMTGDLRLTKQGQIMRQQASEGLQMLEKHLPNYIQGENKAKALEWIKLVTGNIFLVQGIDWTILRLLGDDLSSLFYRKNESADIEMDDDLFFLAEFLDEITSDFDSGCGSDGGSDGGGDSGCGSSGCGGGCGGD